MRIGIMTYHAALNCGAVLQAYALQTFLEDMGHEVEFINFREKKKITIRDYIGKGIFKTWHKLEDIYQAQKHGENDSFGQILKKSKSIYFSLAELRVNPPDYDAYIAGSDQIWNVGSKSVIEKQFYLDFGSSKIKRIAFAASLGQCNIPQFLNTEIKNQLVKFDAISIRESNGVEYIRSLFGEIKEIHHISDPTILLNANDYLKISTKQISIKKDRYIASYILSSYNAEQFKAVNYIKNKLKLKIINLRNPDSCIRLPKAKNIIVTPYQWLDFIHNAEFVICCSFHAVMFALIFHKQFIVISPFTNQRISSLLASLKMDDYFFQNFNHDKIDTIISKPIDWERVDDYFLHEKNKSLNFLLATLS